MQKLVSGSFYGQPETYIGHSVFEHYDGFFQREKLLHQGMSFPVTHTAFLRAGSRDTLGKAQASPG